MKVKSLYPIIVSEQPEKTIQFYQILGFEQKHDAVTLNGNHVYVLSNGDLEMEVIERPADGSVKLSAGMHGMRMNVSDIDAAYRELQEKGCTIVMPPFETEYGKNMLIRDADGVNITLIQHIKK